MDEQSYTVLKKLYVSHLIAEASWDGKKYRLNGEDPVPYAVTQEDRETPLWHQYTLLMGRSAEWMQWSEEQLGITDANRLDRTRELWQECATPRLVAYVTSNLERKRIVKWEYGLSTEKEG